MQYSHAFTLFIVMALLPLSALPASAQSEDEEAVITSHGRMWPVRTDGTTIVWGQADDWIAPATRIMMMDVVSGNPQVLVDDLGEVLALDFDDGVVVWIARQICNECAAGPATEARGINIETGEHFEIGNPDDNEDMVAISGDWIVWSVGILSPGTVEYQPPAWEIRATRLTDLDRYQVVATGLPEPPYLDVYGVSLSNEHVVWWEHQGGRGGGTWSMRATTLNGEPTRVLTTGGVYPPLLDVGGNRVVYLHARRLLVVDLETGVEQQLPTTHFGGRSDPPATDGRFVFWTRNEWSDQLGAKVFDIIGYDIETRSEFTVSEYFLDESGWAPEVGSTALANGVLTWSLKFYKHENQNEWQLFHARLADVLPTAPVYKRDVPLAADFFVETGHTLNHGFQSYWRQHGALPVFGFPLTEEFLQPSEIDGMMQPVQILERQRFEWHAQHQGTPYEVLLGRLGAEDAAARQLLNDPEFQPALPTENDSCAFHETSAHNVCNDFRNYWTTYGLDLNDPDTSYRESLALFGYPLSESFVDPDTGLLTQYFERAVFELHPDNPPAHRILLRRLGTELLEAYGW